MFSYYHYKHPLEHTWTLWYLDTNRAKNWEDRLMDVGSFGTIEDFWCFFNHIKPVSHLKPGCDYALFRKGIRPMWEDKANKDGGRWLASLDAKTTPEEMDRYWLELVMFMIGERSADHGDMINGALINVRPKGNKISLWTKNCENTNGAMITLGLKMKEVLSFSPTQIIVFNSHHEVAKSSSQEQVKVTYYI
ncbi:unnamed protein product [Nesidiocoris tenuis]|uniref:eIF-4F 25 kDa subunit n=2 Tax=Nesidiocoris tenuis TaxID=355587 RepID=A0A6H5GL90_9HEMI|nr:eukaryotic translation initiation factor [Nesidiocoris tenuis]CAB0002379.1 unnamed protein product [Nesidiocoris tenuis]